MEKYKLISVAYTIKLWLLFLVGVISLATSSPSFAGFPFTFGGNGSEKVVDIEVDPFGSIVVLGTFNGTTQFTSQDGGSPIKLISAGGNDIFIAKYAASGDIIWAEQAGGYFEDVPINLSIDSSGAIFISTSARTDSNPGGSNSNGYSIKFGNYLVESFPYDTKKTAAFIANLTRDGIWNWARFTGFSIPGLNGIKTKKSGEIYYLTNHKDLQKRDNNDKVINTEFSAGNKIVLTNFSLADDNDIFVAGDLFLGTNLTVTDVRASANASLGIFEPSNCLPGDAKNRQRFIALITEIRIPGREETEETSKVEESYEYECKWAKVLEKLGNDALPQPIELATDGLNLYYTNNGKIIKVSNNGTNTRPTNITYSALDYSSLRKGLKLETDHEGNLFMVGNYIGAPKFLENVKLPMADVNNVFVAKWNLGGELQWLAAPDRSDTSTIENELGIDGHIALNQQEDIYLAGSLSGVASFNTLTTTSKLESGNMTYTGAMIFSKESINPDFLSLAFETTELESVSFKVKVPPSATGELTVFNIANDTHFNELSVTINSNKFTIWMAGRTEGTFDLNYTVNDNRWHTFKIRLDASEVEPGDWKIRYALSHNNNEITKFRDYYYYRPSPSINAQNLIIGQSLMSSTVFDPAKAFEGQIDDFSISSSNGVIANWTFDGALRDDGKFEDISGNGHHIEPHASRVEAPSDGYLALIDGFNGTWLAPQEWTVGQAIEAPPGVANELQPDISIEGQPITAFSQYFFWSIFEKKLYPIGVSPGTVTIKWKLNNNPLDQARREITGVSTLEGAKIQYHVKDAPVT